jgi:anti-anti-sigma factor
MPCTAAGQDMRMKEINIKDSLKITPLQIGGDDHKVQLILHGYLDTYNSPEFQTHINGLINDGVQLIVFNCNGLNYISSTGIGAFTSFLKLLKQRKGDMVLYGLQAKVREVFELLGFTKFFKIADNMDDALGKLGQDHRTEEDTGQVEEIGETIFPLVFTCPHCGKRLKTVKPGKFRCSGCKWVIAMDMDGTVRSE